MRPLPAKSKNSLILLQLFLVIALPFATTFLLDIPVIAKQLARVILIYFLIIIEITVITASLISTIKSN